MLPITLLSFPLLNQVPQNRQQRHQQKDKFWSEKYFSLLRANKISLNTVKTE